MGADVAPAFTGAPRAENVDTICTGQSSEAFSGRMSRPTPARSAPATMASRVKMASSAAAGSGNAARMSSSISSAMSGPAAAPVQGGGQAVAVESKDDQHAGDGHDGSDISPLSDPASRESPYESRPLALSAGSCTSDPTTIQNMKKCSQVDHRTMDKMPPRIRQQNALSKFRRVDDAPTSAIPTG